MVTMISEDTLFVVGDGESLDLECHYHAEDYDLFHNPVLWWKTQKDEESQINIMSSINEPFLKTDRYSVEFTETPPFYRLQLHIASEILDSDKYRVLLLMHLD